MSLSYFTIFNPSMGPDEDSLPNQLIFYTSAAMSDVDTQLRNIGLVQGIVELGRSFSRADADPIHCVKSKDTRSYLFELDDGFWSVICLSVINEDGARLKEMPPTLQVRRQIILAYRQFVVEHNTFIVNFENNSRETAIRTIESWWIRWAWSEDFLNQDAINLVDGAPQTQVELSRQGEQEVNEWVTGLLQSLDYQNITISIVLEDGYLWCQPSSQYTASDARCLHRCVRQCALQSQHQNSTEPATGNSSAADESMGTSAWFTANKWSTETARLFSVLSHTSKAPASDPRLEESSPISGFIYKDFRSIYLQPATDDDKRVSERNMNIFRFENTYIVITMDSDVASVWNGLERQIKGLLPRFPHQRVKAKAVSPPLFYSLVFDSVTGKTYSNLPSLASALIESATDSALQKQVKENTVYLHRQIYEICSRNVPESVVKTSKNIWIIIKRDHHGLVVLCKSSKSGETMEEIEREGQLEITKLRRTHRSNMT